jgi:hypothetical protein
VNAPESRESLEGWLGLPLLDDEEYDLITDLKPEHVGRGREFFVVILQAFRAGRELGYQEARYEWGTG